MRRRAAALDQQARAATGEAATGEAATDEVATPVQALVARWNAARGVAVAKLQNAPPDDISGTKASASALREYVETCSATDTSSH